MKRKRLLIHLQSSLWVVPVLCVLAGMAISFGTIAVDRASDYDAIPKTLVGGPDAAAAVLSTVAASMVSLTALVLTITMVVVQLAMGQFSPRIVQTILQDKPSQFAIGLFVATFVHAILALREVSNNGDGTGNVPGVAVLASFMLVLASIVVLVVYVQHIGRALRVSALIELVGKDTRALIDRVYPDKGPGLADPTSSTRQVLAKKSGVITAIGTESLVAAATKSDCELEMVPALGEFVPADGTLFRVHGEAQQLDEDELRNALIQMLEPTLDEDVSYGIRLLVDIAERSLSESPFQDPTTAVQAVDRLHDVLRQLIRRPFPDGVHRDAADRVRLTVRSMTWEDYVILATEEIRSVGAASPQVSRRLKAALIDLRSIAPPERLEVIERQLALLETDVKASKDDKRDVEFALTADRKGIGLSSRTDGRASEPG